MIASNETRSVREFVEAAFQYAGMDIVWEGHGVHEIGRDKTDGKIRVRINPQFFRPAEVDVLWGNPAKAEKELGWKRLISFEKLVECMVKNDLEIVEKKIRTGYM